jgi:hypothetical protein
MAEGRAVRAEKEGMIDAEARQSRQMACLQSDAIETCKGHQK